MSDNSVLKLSQPSTFSDPLTEVLRSGARSLLARAVEAEVAAFLDGHSEARTEEGRRRLVRHGHLPEREIMTGIGPVAVRAPRVRDPLRGGAAAGVQPGAHCRARAAPEPGRAAPLAAPLRPLGWDADWSYWFARQGQPTPDLSRASGFRLYSMLVQAAASGLGAAIGRPMLIARELNDRTLVPLFDRQEEAPERCCLITTAASRQRPELRAFRDWILLEAGAAPPPAAGPGFPDP